MSKTEKEHPDAPARKGRCCVVDPGKEGASDMPRPRADALSRTQCRFERSCRQSNLAYRKGKNDRATARLSRRGRSAFLLSFCAVDKTKTLCARMLFFCTHPVPGNRPLVQNWFLLVVRRCCGRRCRARGRLPLLAASHVHIPAKAAGNAKRPAKSAETLGRRIATPPCILRPTLPPARSPSHLPARTSTMPARPSIVGPAAGPAPPFPVQMEGPIISGFGRGSKEVSEPASGLSFFFIYSFLA